MDIGKNKTKFSFLLRYGRTEQETCRNGNNTALPEITLFITAYNEEQVVDGKMKNCHELDYPKEKLHIVWVTDGSNDRTNEKLKAYPDVTLLFVPERKGKTAAMNREWDLSPRLWSYSQTPIHLLIRRPFAR